MQSHAVRLVPTRVTKISNFLLCLAALRSATMSKKVLFVLTNVNKFATIDKQTG